MQAVPTATTGGELANCVGSAHVSVPATGVLVLTQNAEYDEALVAVQYTVKVPDVVPPLTVGVVGAVGGVGGHAVLPTVCPTHDVPHEFRATT